MNFAEENHEGMMNFKKLKEKLVLLIEMEIISPNSPPPKTIHIQYYYVYFKDNTKFKGNGKLLKYKQELK